MYTQAGSLLALSTLLTLNAQAATVIPVLGGQATGVGTAFENIGPFFDSQPVTVPVVGPTINLFGGAGTFFANSGRGFFLDFGTGYSSITVSDVYVGLKVNGTDSTGVNVFYFWSSNTDVHYDPLGGDTLAPDFNLFTFAGATSAKSWQQIYNGVDVVPQERYLIGAFSGGAVTNRIEEIVFVSNVPEPSGAALFALAMTGVTCFGGRRRK